MVCRTLRTNNIPQAQLIKSNVPKMNFIGGLADYLRGASNSSVSRGSLARVGQLLYDDAKVEDACEK